MSEPSAADRGAQVKVVEEWAFRQKHEHMCGCDHEQNDPWCVVGAVEIMSLALAAARAEQRERDAEVCEERAMRYRVAQAPGWECVEHECLQCAAAIRESRP